MAYTLVNVPYGALNASLTRDTDEITKLTATRMFLANLGGLAVAYGIPIIVKSLSRMEESILLSRATPGFITMTIYALVGLALLIFATPRRKSGW